MEMGKTLKKLRIEEKLTQQQLAQALGITRSALSLYETDRRQIPHELVLQITKYFDITLNFLYGQE